MSDRVIYATKNDTVTTANSSGFNGFDFPYATGPTGTGTQRPLMVTVQQSKKWWSRVKTWTMASTWSCVISGVTYAFDNGPMTPQSPSTSELDLVRPGTPRQNVATQTPPSANGIFTLALDPTFSLDDPTNLAGNVWVALGVPSGFTTTGGTLGAPGSSSLGVYFACVPTAMPGGVATGSFSALLDGEAFDLYYFDAGTDSYSAGAMEFTPTEFWPYAAMDGSPIYDTATGAQLQSPTN